MKENTEFLLEASRDVGLEINAEKTKYMVMSCHPNSGQNQNIRIANELFEGVATFRYLGTTLSWTFGRQGSMGRTGFGWLRIGSSGGIL